MGPNQVAGAGSQIWKGKARTDYQAGATRLGQRNLLHRSLRLCLATVANRLRPLANRLWLLPYVEQVIGRGDSFTTRCGTACARPRGERSRRRRPSLTANRSRPPIKPETAATTRAKT